jgi:hypothetical protein
MYRNLALLCVAAFAFARTAAADIPGFENKDLLEKVMAGEIEAEDVIATKTEFRTIFRLFVPKRDAEAWIGVATDHAKYPTIIDAVKSGQTVHVNHDRSIFDYKLHIVVKVGPFTQHVYPEGRQVVTRAHDAVSETKMMNTINNYGEMFVSNSEATRIIPHEGGILIYDDVHFKLKKESGHAALIQKHLKKNALAILEGFRSVLTQ